MLRVLHDFGHEGDPSDHNRMIPISQHALELVDIPLNQLRDLAGNLEGTEDGLKQMLRKWAHQERIQLCSNQMRSSQIKS